MKKEVGVSRAKESSFTTRQTTNKSFSTGAVLFLTIAQMEIYFNSARTEQK
jgi:hypothetical protein